MNQNLNSYIKKATLAGLLVVMGRTGLGQALPAHEISPEGHPCLRGEVIVQFRPEVTDAQIDLAFRRGGLSMLRHVQTPAMKAHGMLGLTHASTTMPVFAALRALNQLPGIEFAEPNWVASSDSLSNDPLYLDGSLWNMYGDDSTPVGPAGTTNPFGAQAEQAWAAGYVGSPDVFIGNIDSGLEHSHPDLAANIWTNPGEIPGNGIDDDNDGYIDDVHGWNSMNDNGVTYDLNDIPNEIHGTATAGVAGAAGGNGLGVAGVAWNVKIIVGKFLPQGAYLDAVQAIDYMTTLKTRKGLNIVVLNNSWSGAAFSQALLDAYSRAAQAGILATCSAGNKSTNSDATPYYPQSLNTTAGAGYDSIISVAATDRTGQKASFSNWGQNSVDLAAPGADITSTVPGGYAGGKNGTSYSAPLVAGAIALYATAYPGAPASQIRQNLLTYGTRPLASLAGITATGGSLDIPAFLAAPASIATPPSAPADVRLAVVSGARIDIAWTDSSVNELGFALERSSDGQTFLLLDSVGANLVAYSDRTVRPGSTYYYRVRSFNPAGSSSYVNAPAPATTPTVTLPAAPSGLSASTQPGKTGGVALAWTDRSNNEDSFQVERKTTTAGTWQTLVSLASNTTRYTDLSTVSRTVYVYRVRASNAAGISGYSNEVSATSK